MLITRKDLRRLGISDYQVRHLTKTLKPVQKQGNTYLYRKLDILSAIKKRIKSSRIHKATLKALKQLIGKIEETDDLGPINQKLIDSAQDLSQIITDFQETIKAGRKLSTKIKTIQQSAKQHNISHPDPGINNIITVDRYRCV